MYWTPGQWITKCQMRAVIAKIETKRGGWQIRGAIVCPSTGVLALAEWDHGGHILSVSGVATADGDFDLTQDRYDKEK